MIYAAYAQRAARNEYGAFVPARRRLGEVEGATSAAAQAAAEREYGDAITPEECIIVEARRGA